eukprot:CAMPEP_0196668140 /NCGR_PEP_ID=MMETSP1086-20130531/65461_1 /TAXON_ID=77921 /ORGANISM="Cyanoptyche  gloeocystis , Strain SAG4.97" /LENGTH=156 /DNA_ID=CAMNT_0042005525 /DNA_START=507 /DNA_END=977 /DNA_ORIENTATION=+
MVGHGEAGGGPLRRVEGTRQEARVGGPHDEAELGKGPAEPDIVDTHLLVVVVKMGDRRIGLMHLEVRRRVVVLHQMVAHVVVAPVEIARQEHARRVETVLGDVGVDEGGDVLDLLVSQEGIETVVRKCQMCVHHDQTLILGLARLRFVLEVGGDYW